MHFCSLWSLLSEINPNQHCSEIDIYFFSRYSVQDLFLP